MARITVLGGTGYTGAAVVAEAAKRGHEITSVSRTVPPNRIQGVNYVIGSVLDDDVLNTALPGRDVVYSALAPRGDMAGKLEGFVEVLISRLAGTPTRLGYTGGASSLHTEVGGPRLWEVTKDHLPAEVKPEIETGITVYTSFQESPESLDWFFVSPPADYGAWLNTPDKGTYVLGGDVQLKDPDGNSTISAADLAIAVVDEIETPTHHRARFTAIH